MKRIMLRTGIVLFCIWHMCAVLVFATPRAATDSFAKASQQFLLPLVMPYMYTTSQWQLWDLFAPDPLRQIALYRIERQDADGGEWKEVITYKPGTFHWWQHASYFKYFSNVLNTSSEIMDPAKEEFLQFACTGNHIPPATPVRLVLYTTVLPWLLTPVSADYWNSWTPEWTRTISMLSICKVTLQ